MGSKNMAGVETTGTSSRIIKGQYEKQEKCEGRDFYFPSKNE